MLHDSHASNVLGPSSFVFPTRLLAGSLIGDRLSPNDHSKMRVNYASASDCAHRLLNARANALSSGRSLIRSTTSSASVLVDPDASLLIAWQVGARSKVCSLLPVEAMEIWGRLLGAAPVYCMSSV